MKKFSKLLAVLVALAVIICPMTSAIVANATTTGSYSIVADTANDVVLTIHSDDGFVVYQATVTFNSDSSFVNNYSSNGYTNGLKVVDYSMVDAAKDEYNAPAISAQQNGASLVLLVSATNGANMDLYQEIQIGIRVQSGTTANLSNIRAADDGDVTEDPTLLNFGSKVDASTGDVTINNNPNATTGESHTHNFQMTDTIVATPATCKTPVQYYKVCSICGATGDTYAGDTYADHTPTVQAKDAAHLASAATCTADATYFYGCAVCGTVVKSDKQGYTGTWTDTGTATNHANKVYHPASAATCTANGNTAYYSCPDCGKYFSDAACTIEIANNSWVTAMTDHTASNTETYLKTAATCTDNAIYYQTCSVCGAKLNTTWVKAGTATGHSFTSYTYNNDATCTAAGTETATCANGCGTTDTRTSAEHPALGHDWVAGTVTAPTCTVAGNTHYTCSRCDATKDEPIAATGHTEETIPAVAATCTTAGATAGVKCSVCNEILTAPTPIAALGHNMTAHTANAATCTAAGNSAYWSCDRCNKFFSDEEGNTEIAENSWVIAATGHTPVTDAAVAATCVATGLTEGSHCSVCNAVLVAQTETPIDPTNHTNIVNDAAVAATCTETGLTAGSHCAACDTVIVAQETVNALGHDYTYTDHGDGTHDIGCTRCDYAANEACVDANDDGFCDLCNAELACDHNYVGVVTTQPTKTATGVMTYTCSLCGDSYTETIAIPAQISNVAFNHTLLVSEVVADSITVSTKQMRTNYGDGATYFIDIEYQTFSSSANPYNLTNAHTVLTSANRKASSTANRDDLAFDKMALYEMTLDFDMTLYIKNASGVVIAYREFESSLADMAYTMASQNPTRTNLLTCLADMCNYGKAVQEYFAGTNPTKDIASATDPTTILGDYMVNASDIDILPGAGEYDNTKLATQKVVSSTGFVSAGMTLSVGASNMINYTLRADNYNLADCEIVMSYDSIYGDSREFTVDMSELTPNGTTSAGKQKYDYNFKNLAIYDANAVVTMSMYHNGVLECTSQYSVGNFANSYIAQSSNLGNVIRMMELFANSTAIQLGRGSIF